MDGNQADYFKVDIWMVPGWLLQSGRMDGTRLITSKWTNGWYQADYFKVDISMVPG